MSACGMPPPPTCVSKALFVLTAKLSVAKRSSSQEKGKAGGSRRSGKRSRFVDHI